MVRGKRRQRGSVLPLMALAVLLVGAMVLGLGRLGRATVSRARAQAAADAAALAGAVEGRNAAENLATANGAEMVSFEIVDGATRVTVRVGEAQAVARAAATHDRGPAMP